MLAVVWLFSMALGAPAPDPSVQTRQERLEEGEQFGFELLVIDDVDGRGQRDFVVGAPNWSPDDSDWRGCILAFSTETQGVLWMLPGLEDEQRFGGRLRAFDDVDGDGLRDLLVGRETVFHDGITWIGGSTSVVSAATGERLWTLPRSLHYLAPIHDLDGDGRRDLALGTATGLEFLSGCDGRKLASEQLEPWMSAARRHPPDRWGTSALRWCEVEGVGDLDGDGTDEIVVIREGVHDGPVLLRYGDGETIRELEFLQGGSVRDHQFEWGISGIEDFDGDGLRELWVARHDYGRGHAEAWVVGSATGEPLLAFPGKSWPRKSGSHAPGFGVATLGDLTGDGVPDFVVGTPWGWGASFVRALSGSDGRVEWHLGTWSFVQGPCYLGDTLLPHAIVRFDDLDGDDAPEVLVGSCDWNIDKGRIERQGAVLALSGRTGATLWCIRVENVAWLSSSAR